MLMLGTVQGSGYLLADKVLSTAQSLVVQLTCTLAMAGVENQTTSVGSSAPVSTESTHPSQPVLLMASGRQGCADKDMAQRVLLTG